MMKQARSRASGVKHLDRVLKGTTFRQAKMSEEPLNESAPDDAGKFSISEDWAATVVGLLLLAMCLLGWITKDMLAVI